MKSKDPLIHNVIGDVEASRLTSTMRCTDNIGGQVLLDVVDKVTRTHREILSDRHQHRYRACFLIFIVISLRTVSINLTELSKSGV